MAWWEVKVATLAPGAGQLVYLELGSLAVGFTACPAQTTTARREEGGRQQLWPLTGWL